MVIFLLFYFIIYLIIWWGYSGYTIFLYVASRFMDKKSLFADIKDYPAITVVVPCFNEELLVSSKIKNIAGLNYPREKLKVLFLDGNSTDNTVTEIKTAIEPFDFMKVIETNCAGKINQLNFILPSIITDIIVNTDMDAELDSSLLIEIVREFQKDEKIGVVGAYVIPRSCLNEEKLYWRNQNHARLLESRVHSSSIVIAGCYAFRREVIDLFPQDVIADDVYLPFESNFKGYRTIYSQSSIAYEMRCPNSLSEMLRHKFRKSNAYLTEILRFLYKLPYMKFTWKIIYLTKVVQFLIMPWFLLVFSLMTGQLFFLGEKNVIKILLYFLFVSLLLAHFIIIQPKTKVKEKKGGLLLTPQVFIISVFILLLTGLTYPFFRQTSSYKKI